MLMIGVANGTAIEKANRISEVLLAIVRPSALLFGKVIGVGLVGILTILAATLPVLIKYLAGGDLPAGAGSAVVGGAAWFILGLALYLTIAASLGALVERQEETGSVITPLSILLVATYLVAHQRGRHPSRHGPRLHPAHLPADHAVEAGPGGRLAVRDRRLAHPRASSPSSSWPGSVPSCTAGASCGPDGA